MRKPQPAPGQRWRFDREEGVIVAIYPGGGGGRGIAEFSGGRIPPSHVSTMLRFDAWVYLTSEDLAPPCRCVVLEGGVLLTDQCAVHSAACASAGFAQAVEPSPAALGGAHLAPRSAP